MGDEDRMYGSLPRCNKSDANSMPCSTTQADKMKLSSILDDTSSQQNSLEETLNSDLSPEIQDNTQDSTLDSTQDSFKSEVDTKEYLDLIEALGNIALKLEQRKEKVKALLEAGDAIGHDVLCINSDLKLWLENYEGKVQKLTHPSDDDDARRIYFTRNIWHSLEETEMLKEEIHDLAEYLTSDFSLVNARVAKVGGKKPDWDRE